MSGLAFRIASTVDEIDQIQALTYRAFVEEIPQHARNDAARHVDRFHAENTYLIALDGDRVVGTVALRDRRPFSLDQKLTDLDRYLPPGSRPCEVRLLTVDPTRRRRRVLPGLISLLWRVAADRGLDVAVISATTRQLHLYEHMGFKPFGPLVGTAAAPFQPMLIERETFQRRARAVAVSAPPPRSFLPGPVSIAPAVRAAFEQLPASHRQARFTGAIDSVRTLLCRLTGARHAAVMLGSGSLANDAVASQLAIGGGRGVVVSNGEFGERLLDHATRAGLPFSRLSFPWGSALDLDRIAVRLEAERPSWLWAVACETSTGVLNDVAALVALCRSRGVALSLDCISAIGAVPLDLSQVEFATGSSGKALGSYAGLALVLYNHDISPDPRLPRYLDLGLYQSAGVPFTHSSNLVDALRVSLEATDWNERMRRVAATGRWVRERIAALGYEIVGATSAAPHVITIALDGGASSSDLAAVLERAGCLVAYASGYLRTRNWIQVCVMAELAPRDLAPLLRELRRNRSSAAPVALRCATTSP